MTTGRRALGAFGEQLAAQWYESQGYIVLDRNWRCREGEIDLVLTRSRTLVFCEVKTRSSNAFGSPASAVTVVKQLRLRKLGMRWIDTHEVRAVTVRFDVACVVGREVTVIESAF